MPAKINDLDRMLRGKLQAVTQEGAKHTKYYVYADDKMRIKKQSGLNDYS